ncbi:MAG: hydroxyphenylacetyl-CoA thioesterase PaaI [Actinomycetota bacterium]
MSEVSEPSPDDVARHMYASDAASQLLGITIDDVDDGSSTLSMVVRDDMVNGLDVCHGGFVFTLADSAMAFASMGGNHASLASSATIDWLAPAFRGTRLVATATTVRQGRRAGLTDVTVSDADGELVAVFRGRTSRTGAPVV